MLRLWVLSFLGLIVVFGFACSSDEEVAPSSTQSPIIATTSVKPTVTFIPDGSPSPTAAWKTFENIDYGFSFKYPGDWYLDVHGRLPDTRMDYIGVSTFPPRPSPGVTPPAGSFRLEMYVDSNAAGQNLSDWTSTSHSLPGEPADVVVTSREIATAAHPGIEQTVIAGDSPSQTPTYQDFFAIDDKILTVFGPAEDSATLSTYQQIIGSLRFGQPS